MTLVSSPLQIRTRTAWCGVSATSTWPSPVFGARVAGGGREEKHPRAGARHEAEPRGTPRRRRTLSWPTPASTRQTEGRGGRRRSAGPTRRGGTHVTASGLVPSPSAHPPPWPARGGPGNIEWWREGDDTGHRRAVRALDAAWGAVNFAAPAL